MRPESADLKPERGDFRKNERTNKQMNELMDKQKFPCVLQDFVPFGAAAQKAAMKLNLRGQISGLRRQIQGLRG